jgi:branched-subunit amino acid transport protein
MSYACGAIFPRFVHHLRCEIPIMDINKLQRLKADFAQQGLNPVLATPPVFRFFWALGIKLPPPAFLSSVSVAILFAISYATLVGLGLSLLWPFALVDSGIPTQILIWLGPTAGLILGVSMAVYYRRAKNKLRLPSWQDYADD